MSIATSLNLSDNMKIDDVNGRPHILTQYQVQMILVIGWVSFLASWISNIIYYKVHPSEVDFNLRRSTDRLFVYLFGKRVSCLDTRINILMQRSDLGGSQVTNEGEQIYWV